MIDSVQLVLLVVIIVLTALLVILGVQVFLILRDVRKTISKTNKILNTAELITENIEGPLSALSSLALGIRGSSVMTAIKIIKNLLGREKEPERRHHE